VRTGGRALGGILILKKIATNLVEIFFTNSQGIDFLKNIFKTEQNLDKIFKFLNK